ncbi:SDR family NAD(P)-dependent oxidoreductase [Novosphingobium colocasiae]
MKLNSSVAAVVTGGASGLGRATAAALAEKKGSRSRSSTSTSRKERRSQLKFRAHFCAVNVASDEQVDAAFRKARKAHGQERILVNCAGIGGPAKTVSRARDTGALSHFPLDLFERVIQVNLIGTFRSVVKSAVGMAALDPLEEGHRGVIINTASVAAEDGQVGQAAYTASKAAIVGMTLPVARDLMSEGIRINTILPGIFSTPLMMTAGDKVVDALSAMVPFPKRLGRPDEYAALALAMIENDYFNGEDVRLDGGIRMAPR